MHPDITYECWTSLGFDEFATLGEAKAFMERYRLLGKVWRCDAFTGQSRAVVEYVA